MGSFQERADELFPGHVEEKAFVEATARLLLPLGFSPRTAIACVGVCRDEVSHPMIDHVIGVWGQAFNFASLAGMLTLGKTGFGAAHAHSPIEDGRERYVYYCMPHIGIGPEGEVGKVARLHRPGESTACGALAAFQSELASGEMSFGFDDTDPEQSLLRERLSRRLKWGQTPDLLDVTRLAHKVILEDLERSIEATVDTSKADYAVFSGVQIHGPERVNHIWPGPMYAVVSGDRKDLSL